MESWLVRVLGPLLLAMTVGFGGCNIASSFDGVTASLDDAQFKNLWRMYSHCRFGSDPEEMRADAEGLNRAVQAITLKTQASTFLPDIMRNLVSELPSRLAVDPRAMVVACTLYAGQAAQSLGQLRLAEAMFNSIMTTKSEPEYASYVVQASRGLEQLEQDTHVMTGMSEQAIEVSSTRTDPDGS